MSLSRTHLTNPHDPRSRQIAVLGISLLLAACGFQLRTQPNIPPEMSRTYMAADDSYSLFYRRFQDELAKAGVEVVSSRADATAIFSILVDHTDQRVLSVSAQNLPREFEVYYTIHYSVESGKQSIIEPQTLTLTRDYTYDETLVLGKAREEELLRQAIVDDLVRIIIKQLSSL